MVGRELRRWKLGVGGSWFHPLSPLVLSLHQEASLLKAISRQPTALTEGSSCSWGFRESSGYYRPQRYALSFMGNKFSPLGVTGW